MKGRIDSQIPQNAIWGIHGPRLSRWRFRAVSASLILVLLGEGFALPAFSARGESQQLEESYRDFSAALSGLGGTQKLSPKQAADRLESLFGDIEEARKGIPRDTFDLGAIITGVGNDPIALFEWVRDNTYLVPYRGVLRGHQGVLMDRLGNSFDRALLLYTLLRETKKDVRLAHGSLSRNQAEEVFKKARPIPREGVWSGADSIGEEADAFLDTYAQTHQLNAKEIREKYRKLQSEQRKYSEQVGKRVREQAGDLANMVGNPDGSAKKAGFAAAVEAVRDHWWVQTSDGSKWTDLDPTLPDADAGQSLITPAETLQPVNYSEVKDLCHSIRIRLEIEYWEKGKLEKAEIFNQMMLPVVMFGKRIVLSHVPPAWPQDLTIYQGEHAEENLKRAVLNQREWLPVLSVDAASIYKYSFVTDSKNIFDATLPNWAAAALKGREVVDATKAGGEAAGNKVRDMLSRRSRVRQPQESKAPAGVHLTGEWVEYEIDVPGRKPQKIRREIFDWIGPARRASAGDNLALPEITEDMRLERGHALLEQIEILPLVCRLSPEFVADLTAEKMLANQKILLDVLRSGELSINQKMLKTLGLLTPLPSPGYSLALAREEWSRFGGEVFLDRPNILSYFRGVRQCKPLQYQGYDIIANEVAVHPNSRVDPFQARLEQGVADTNAEAFLLGGPGRIIDNAAELYDISKRRDNDWLIVRDASDPAWKDISLGADMKERIERELSAGYIAVVPKTALAVEGRDLFGWWRIDPNTGYTLGTGEKGRGQTSIEKVIVNTAVHIAGFVYCLMSISDTKNDILLTAQWASCIYGISFYANALVTGIFVKRIALYLGAFNGLLFGVPTIISSIE